MFTYSLRALKPENYDDILTKVTHSLGISTRLRRMKMYCAQTDIKTLPHAAYQRLTEPGSRWTTWEVQMFLLFTRHPRFSFNPYPLDHASKNIENAIVAILRHLLLNRRQICHVYMNATTFGFPPEAKSQLGTQAYPQHAMLFALSYVINQMPTESPDLKKLKNALSVNGSTPSASLATVGLKGWLCTLVFGLIDEHADLRDLLLPLGRSSLMHSAVSDADIQYTPGNSHSFRLVLPAADNAMANPVSALAMHRQLTVVGDHDEIDPRVTFMHVLADAHLMEAERLLDSYTKHASSGNTGNPQDLTDALQQVYLALKIRDDYSGHWLRAGLHEKQQVGSCDESERIIAYEKLVDDGIPAGHRRSISGPLAVALYGKDGNKKQTFHWMLHSALDSLVYIKTLEAGSEEYKRRGDELVAKFNTCANYNKCNQCLFTSPYHISDGYAHVGTASNTELWETLQAEFGALTSTLVAHGIDYSPLAESDQPAGSPAAAHSPA